MTPHEIPKEVTKSSKWKSKLETLYFQLHNFFSTKNWTQSLTFPRLHLYHRAKSSALKIYYKDTSMKTLYVMLTYKQIYSSMKQKRQPRNTLVYLY